MDQPGKKPLSLITRLGDLILAFAGQRPSKHFRVAEGIFVALLAAGQIWLFRSLFSERMLLMGDSILWYGMFHYFTESLLAGVWPYWNPYVHGGEPFFLAWNIIRLTDPVTLTTILISSIFSPDLYRLYNVVFVARMVVTAIGCYLLLRQLQLRLVSLASASLMLFWGILGGQSLTVIGYLDAFSWFPWALWCLLRALRAARIPQQRSNVGYWIVAMSWFVAISIGGAIYHWAYSVFVLTVFVIFLVVFRRRELLQLLRKARWSLAVGMAVIVAMSAPIVGLFLERHEIFPSARNMNREKLEAGPATLLAVDYAQIAKRAPVVGLGEIDKLVNSLPGISKGYDAWFVGHLAGIFAIVGLFLGRHRYQWPLVGAFVVTAFMFFGPLPPLHQLHEIIYYAFPPLWLTRHLSIFEPFVFLFIAIFVGLGVDRSVSLIRRLILHWGIQSPDRHRPGAITPVIVPADVAAVVGVFVYAVVLDSSMSRIADLEWLRFPLSVGAFILIFAIVALVQSRGSAPAITAAAILIVPAFVVQLVEQSVIAVGIHRVPAQCDNPHFCEWDHYFEKFSFPRAALRTLPAPTSRVLGMNLGKGYLSYSPTIFKRNVALEDIMPAQAKPAIHTHFTPRMSFPMGLYHFWLKEYLRIYEIGESQPEAFLALMGVDRPLIDYRTNHVLSGQDPDAVLKETDGSMTRAIVEVAAMVDSPPASKQAGITLVDAISYIRKEKREPNRATLYQGSIDNLMRRGELHTWELRREYENQEFARIPILTSPILTSSEVAIRLAPDQRGPAMLRLSQSAVAAVIGKDIDINIWVRSGNKTPDAVTVDLQTTENSSPVAIKSYDNVGAWQKLQLRSRIQPGAKFLLLTLHVAPNATAPADFGRIRIELVDPIDHGGADTKAAVVSLFPNPPDKMFEANTVSFSPNRLELDVKAGSPGILTYRDISRRHWKAYVDGELVPLLRSDLAFKAVSLDPGRHRVIFEYHPTFFSVALYVYLAGIIIGLCYLVARPILRKSSFKVN